MSTVTRYEVRGMEDEPVQIEAIHRDDWTGMTDPCPECNGTEFDHIRYEGVHYGRMDNTTVLRTDYWAQKGSIYTACKRCETVLYKHPAYDLLRVFDPSRGQSNE